MEDPSFDLLLRDPVMRVLNAVFFVSATIASWRWSSAPFRSNPGPEIWIGKDFRTGGKTGEYGHKLAPTQGWLNWQYLYVMTALLSALASLAYAAYRLDGPEAY